MVLIGAGHERVLGLVIEDWSTDANTVYLWAILSTGPGSGPILGNNITRHDARVAAGSLRELLSVVQGGYPVPIIEVEFDGVKEIADQLRGEA